MKRRVEQALESIVDVVFSWPAVDSVVVMDSELDELDPYFLVSLDLYVNGNLPPLEIRQQALHFTGGYESNEANRKDRFLYRDLPFRLEYKSRDRISYLLEGGREASVRENGTYALHRLQVGRTLRQRSEWLSGVKSRLEGLGREFWEPMLDVYVGRMEQALNDMAAAVARQDSFFYTLSLAAFLSALTSALFARNRCFEPAARFLREQLLRLPLLPDAFPGMLDSLLREGPDRRDRQREIAEYLARRVLAL